MNQTQLPAFQLILVCGFLLALACCAGLWRRFKRAPRPSRSAWLLCALAGALPLASLLVFVLAPSSALDANFLFLGWLLGIAVGGASLLMKSPRLATGFLAGLSTGCLCAFIGAFVLAMLD